MHLPALIRAKKLAIDYVHIERKQIEETGEYDLEGLFIRLRAAIEQVKAKRVLLDTIELLFLGLRNDGIVRAELRRLSIGSKMPASLPWSLLKWETAHSPAMRWKSMLPIAFLFLITASTNKFPPGACAW